MTDHRIPVMLPTARAARVGRAVDSAVRLERLLARVARGDQSAYESVYRQVSLPVFGIIHRVLRDQAKAEEVAHEVLLHVWTTASRFDATRGTAMTWVMTLAHRRAVDRLRREEGRSRLPAARPDAISEGGVADGSADRFGQHEVRSCLAALPALQREALMLVYYGGLTNRQVSHELGVPARIAETGIRDGLLRLGDCLRSDTPSTGRPARL